jgi:hypothetical protein
VGRLIIPRHDGTMIDVNGYSSSRKNPFALAQHARHPPPDVHPNCIRIQVDFVPESANTTRLLGFPDYLMPYVPNEWGADISQAQVLHNALDPPDYKPGVALVALRELYDEELFVDYRLNPFRPQPDWYIPHDVNAAERMWSRWLDSSRKSHGRDKWEGYVREHRQLPVGSGGDAEPPEGVKLIE